MKQQLRPFENKLRKALVYIFSLLGIAALVLGLYEHYVHGEKLIPSISAALNGYLLAYILHKNI
ncbi:MAG: hypothetical protein Q4D05_02655 [Acinetobacter sp.]|nr:hypothetical protein [Acinetobacter sp.]